MKKKEKIAINLSPLLRETEYNLAAEMIRSGLNTKNPEDWQQQVLGHESEDSIGSISLEMLKRAIGAPIPDREPNFTLCGIDQGRSEHWMAVIDFYLPEDFWSCERYEIGDRTLRVVRFAGGLVKSEIADRLAVYGVDAGIIDNEPDIEAASRLCDATGILQMADQKAGQLEEWLLDTVRDGGVEYSCYKIRYEKYMRAVLNGFLIDDLMDGYPIYRLPREWEKWLNQLGNERSPLKHLMGPSYSPETGKWERAKDHVDDLYYACHFAEFAFALYLEDYWSAIVQQKLYGN